MQLADFNNLWRQAALALCLLITWGFLGCAETDSQLHNHSATEGHVFHGEYPIQVLCTTGMIAEMLTRIGGEQVEVQGLMGPGVDPHLYRPTAADVDKLLTADAIFYNGMHLEGRMADKFVQLARTQATYPVTAHDPHIWHDVALWSDCATDVATMLAKFDPEHAPEYESRARAYREELAELDAFCKTEIAKIPIAQRLLVTAHDAFGYFGAAYGIEVCGLKGISSEAEKDLAHQEEIQTLLIERQIPAVFVESAIAHRTVDALVETCRAAGWEVVHGGELYADALGPAGSATSTYRGMIRHNVHTIVAGLSGM